MEKEFLRKDLGRDMMKKKSKLLIALMVIIFAGLYYYVTLPAINLHSTDTWFFVIALIVILMVIYALRKKIFIPNDTISLEDEKKIITSTLDICKNNLDIFERFYNDNKEIYEEISNKLVKIRIR